MLSLLFMLLSMSAFADLPDFPDTEEDDDSTPIVISPDLPSDIPGGAPNADLTDAASFAWQQFIALNWPAMSGVRDTPDTSALFGDPTFDGPLVWHTFRHKVEIYPGQGAAPPGFVNDSSQSFGYDSRPPQYTYGTGVGSGASTGSGNGIIPACSGQTPVTDPAFINLDEVSQIGLAAMFAGNAPETVSGNSDPQLIRYLAKANRQHYEYVVDPTAVDPGNPNANPLWNHPSCTSGSTNTYCVAVDNFVAVANGNGTPTSLPGFVVDFPFGAMEVKAAWRELTSTEKQSGRFYQTTVRYYEGGSPTSRADVCYREAEWGLVGLHLEQKIPSAGIFVFATFEQADNILTSSGATVENNHGTVINNTVLNGDPTTPLLTYSDGTPPSLTTDGSSCDDPGSLLFYQEQTNVFPGLPSGNICQNRRDREIPTEVVSVNTEAQKVISSYNVMNGITGSPWANYLLVNIQWQPFDKSEISSSTATNNRDPSTFYLNNIVIETDYTLQSFSGRIYGNPAFGDDTSKGGPPTDLPANFNNFNNRTTFQNVLVFDDSTTGLKEGSTLTNTYNMGGCMGCHGNAQITGTDFSFILGEGRVTAPDTPDTSVDDVSNPAPVDIFVNAP